MEQGTKPRGWLARITGLPKPISLIIAPFMFVFYYIAIPLSAMLDRTSWLLIFDGAAALILNIFGLKTPLFVRTLSALAIFGVYTTLWAISYPVARLFDPVNSFGTVLFLCLATAAICIAASTSVIRWAANEWIREPVLKTATGGVFFFAAIGLLAILMRLAATVAAGALMALIFLTRSFPAQSIAAVLTPVILIASLAFYVLRCRHRIVYGFVEMIAGVIITEWSSREIIGTIAEAGVVEAQNYVTGLLQIMAGVYIIVRALDNIEKGLEQGGTKHPWIYKNWNSFFYANKE